VTSGWSAGGGLGYLRPDKLNSWTQNGRCDDKHGQHHPDNLSFMVASTMVNQDVHCTPYILELTVAALNMLDFALSRSILPVNSSRQTQ